MTVDDRFAAQFAELSQQRRAQRGEADHLPGGGGGGTSDGVEGRITRLEVHMEAVQRDLADIKSDLRSTLEIVRGLPTRSELTTFRWQWVATAVAAIALIVGGIIGGLGWIKPDPAAPTITAVPAPIVIQMPTTPIAGSDAAKPTR